MLNFGNKDFRNLQEQVLFNANEIEALKQLRLGGVEITTIHDTSEDIPAQNGVYLVGTGPYQLYIKADSGLYNLGDFPKAGPTGSMGIAGPRGLQGERGTSWTIGTDFPVNGKLGDFHLKYDGKIYQHDGEEYKYAFSIRGPQGTQGQRGLRGPQGPQGKTGEKGEPGMASSAVKIIGILNNIEQLPDPEIVSRDSAYIIEGDLYIITGEEDLVWTEAGPAIWQLIANNVSFQSSGTGLTGNNVQAALESVGNKFDTKADKFVLTNLADNGDFTLDSNSDGLPDGFTSNFGNKSLSNGILTLQATSSAQVLYPAAHSTLFNMDDKYYTYARVKTSSDTFDLANTTDIISNNEWVFVSTIINASGSSSICRIIDRGTSDFKPIQVDYIGTINLTETFGAGNEPTKEQMDAIMEYKGFFQQTEIGVKDLMLWGFSEESSLLDTASPTEFIEKYENILNGKFNKLLAYNEYEDENPKKIVKVILKGNTNTSTGQVKLKLKSLSENLLQFNNMKTATKNGVWAEIEDGVWTLHGTATGGDAYIRVELKEPVTLSDNYSFIVNCNQITVSNSQIVLQKGTVTKTTLNGVNTNNDVSSRSHSTANAGEIATSVQVKVVDGINVDGFEIRPQLNNGNVSSSIAPFDNNFGEEEIIINSLSGEEVLYLKANSRKFSIELEDSNEMVNLSDSYYIVVGGVEKPVKDILTLNKDHKPNLQAIARYNTSSTNNRRWTMLISTDIHGEWDMVERQIEYLNKNNEIMYGMCLGDIVYSDALDSHQGFIDAVKKTRKPYYITLGNHDSGTGVSAATGNTQQQMFDKFIDPLKKYMKLPSITTNYYSQLFDSSTEGNASTRKVALVVLNSYDIPDTTTGGDFIVTRGVIGYSQAQIDWLCNTLLEIPTNYVLVMSSHALKEKTEVKKCKFSQLRVDSIFGNLEKEGFNLISDIINAWINGTSLTQTYNQGTGLPTISVDVDFSNRGTGLFSCYITGHTHRDLIGNIEKYPNQTIVNLTCSTTGYGQTAPFSDLPRVKGEKSEDALTLISIDNLTETTSLLRVGSNITYNGITRDMISFDFDGNIIE